MVFLAPSCFLSFKNSDVTAGSKKECIILGSRRKKHCSPKAEDGLSAQKVHIQQLMSWILHCLTHLIFIPKHLHGHLKTKADAETNVKKQSGAIDKIKILHILFDSFLTNTHKEKKTSDHMCRITDLVQKWKHRKNRDMRAQRIFG